MTAGTATVAGSRLLLAGLLSVLLAAVATTAVAAVGQAVGISLDMSGQPIPPLGFGSLTLLFGLVGVALAVAVRRWSGRPQRDFLTATVVLTVLSLVPDVLADVSGPTRALLMATHLVAAGIVVPTVARRLP